MARKKKPKEELGGSDWMATYGDMVTLLLTFFVLLFSMSEVDAKKFEAMASAMNSLLTGTSIEGILSSSGESGNMPTIGDIASSDDLESTEATQEKINELIDTLNSYINENNLGDIISAQQNEKGALIRLKDKVLFDLGNANLKPESYEPLNRIGTLIKTINSKIEITGHTDNIPISSSLYRDNTALAFARAESVRRYFIDIDGLDPSRFSSHAKGEYEPIASNDTEEGRASNRRVEIQLTVGEN